MKKYLVTWSSPSIDADYNTVMEREEIVVDADSALEAEVIVHEEYGVRRSLLKVRCVA